MNFLAEKSIKGKVLLFLLCIASYFLVDFYLDTNKECGCGECITDHHPWFMQHFQKDITPLLSSRYNLSEEAYNWWRRLQFGNGNITSFKKIKADIFKLFPARPPVVEPGPDRCRTCAVVGNSGNLRRSHYGKLIDDHNHVFRINFGVTKNFEEDVGNRTTHRVMYPESAMDLNNSTHLVLFPFKILDMQWLVSVFTTGNYRRSYAPLKKFLKGNKNLVMVVNPAFMKYVHETWLQKKGRYPSTGFMTVVLALHLCDQVSVFGFGADSDGNWNHYWEILRNKNLHTGPHPGSVEYDMITKLAIQGKITFYRGW